VVGLVKFEYQPWKKIVVHDIVKVPLELLLSTHSIGVPEGGVGRPLTWVDGILFELITMPATEDIVREQLDGKVHWSSLSYTIMPNYQQSFTMPGNVRIPVINVSDNQVLREMARWIKENFEKR